MANFLGKTTIWTPPDVAGRPAIGFVISRSAVRVRSPAPIESTTYRDMQPSGIRLCQQHGPAVSALGLRHAGQAAGQQPVEAQHQARPPPLRLTGQWEPFGSDMSRPLKRNPAIRRRRGG